MAWDFLAIPGASVAVERLFSRSRQVCTDVHSSLESQTVSQVLCIKKWLESNKVWYKVVEQQKAAHERSAKSDSLWIGVAPDIKNRMAYTEFITAQTKVHSFDLQFTVVVVSAELSSR